MASISLRIPSTLPPGEAWRAIWNLERHSEVIPFTRLRGSALSAQALQPGGEFTARTALGPLGFDDSMRVVRFDAPGTDGFGRAIIEKTGRVVQGHIVMTVRPSPGGCVVTWDQEIRVLGVPTRLGAVTGQVASRSYEQVLRRLLTA